MWCARWTSHRSVRSGGHASVMSKRCAGGCGGSGPRLRNRQRWGGLACDPRQKLEFAKTSRQAHMGASGVNPLSDACVQSEENLDHRRVGAGARARSNPCFPLDRTRQRDRRDGLGILALASPPFARTGHRAVGRVAGPPKRHGAEPDQKPAPLVGRRAVSTLLFGSGIRSAPIASIYVSSSRNRSRSSRQSPPVKMLYVIFNT